MIETMTTARLFFLLAAVTACLPLAGQTYKDPNQPLEKRVDDLLSRMTLEEKASQLLSASPAIEPASSILPPEHWAYDGDVTRYHYDPHQARQILDAAGYRAKDGIRFHIVMKSSDR